jgi:hypothetical protein
MRERREISLYNMREREGMYRRIILKLSTEKYNAVRLIELKWHRM